MCYSQSIKIISLFIRTKEHEREREEKIMEQRKEAEELEQFQELYIKEQTTHKQKKQEEKRNTMKAYQVSISLLLVLVCQFVLFALTQ